MPTAYKILGTQTTSTADVYTVPSATEAVISTIFVCNRAATATTFSLSVRPVAGTAEANQNLIASSVPIAANDTVTITSGITMAAGNVLRFTPGNSNLSISVFGTEIT